MVTQSVWRGGRARTWIASTLLAAAAIPFAYAPALAASHGFPPEGTFDCNSASGIWQKLQLDENHDNLFAKFEATTVHPGQTVSFDLVWEWRDWRPGATLHIHRCLDVDTGAAVDGKETPPVDSLGANPADVSVVHPVDEPTFTVMKGPEVRPAVSRPFTLTVPDSAPPGSEVCMRSAILADPVEHRNSPPDYDISETVCLPVAGPTPTPPGPSPSPSPSESPSPSPSESPSPSPSPSESPSPSPSPCVPPSPGVSPSPGMSPSPGVSPSPGASPSPCESPTVLPTQTTAAPPPEVLGVEELPRTGAPLAMLALAGGLLVLLGAAALARRPKPSAVPASPETPEDRSAGAGTP
jgi:hypothetical protein